MSELFSRFHPGDFIGLVAVGGGLLCGIIAILAGVWHKIRTTEIEVALKQDMLNRGLSAEEIRTVIDAGTKRSRKEFRSQHASKD